MAQKDYVGRGRSTGAHRKGSSRNKKRSRSSGASKIMSVLAVTVFVTFIGGLWFITHHKKEDMPIIPDHKAIGNSLPPKPEERWRYIKELENRQTTVPTPTEPSANGDTHTPTQLTDEQRQLLEQMQADMHQQPTQLNEVPWNEQTPAQRQQTIQLQQQSRMPQQPPTHTAPITPVTREPVRQSETTTQEKPDSKPKEMEKEKPQHWMVQCGSFKRPDQAESIRAQLAFEGFESHITTDDGWNRVVLGPYNNRSSANNTLKNLHGSGHANCIPVSIGG